MWVYSPCAIDQLLARWVMRERRSASAGIDTTSPTVTLASDAFSPKEALSDDGAGSRNEGEPVAADHGARHQPVRDVPRRVGRSAGAGLPGRVDAPHLPPAGDRGPARLAEGSGRLGAAWSRRRAEGRASGQRGGLGTVGRQPGRRLVWPAQGLSRAVRHVPAAAA